jgi:MOSC domain-containing protein YiiM
MHILSISVGKVSKLVILGDGPSRNVNSAIEKKPMSDEDHPIPVFVGRLGLEGDQQADLNVHGGAEKAVYVYPVEHYPFWQKLLQEHASELGTLSHGFFGENLTIEGLTEDGVFVGDLWTVGEVEFLVEELRKPCFKFDSKIGFKAGPHMVLSARSGWYLSVLQPGIIKAGDKITVQPGERSVSIAKQNEALKRERKL